jgi:hypothetical protein
MKAYLEQYLALESAVKGEKKLWVKRNIYQPYIKEFDAGGPNGVELTSLLEVRVYFVPSRCHFD